MELLTILLWSKFWRRLQITKGNICVIEILKWNINYNFKGGAVGNICDTQLPTEDECFRLWSMIAAKSALTSESKWAEPSWSSSAHWSAPLMLLMMMFRDNDTFNFDYGDVTYHNYDD